MTRLVCKGAWCLALLFGLLAQAMAAGPVVVLTLDDAIGPASADYINRGLARAASADAQLAVLQIDTPGGLDTSMRSITKAILASPVPVAGFVAPGGARAASAGTYILYASHVAAMAPGTNLGAATPVQVGAMPNAPEAPDERGQAPREAEPDTLEKKQINDAAAYIRGLAQLRGRNAKWAEQAVREGVSLPASEALERGVIEYLAVDLDDLLEQLDGKELHTSIGPVQLHTAKTTPTFYQADWRTRLLSVITNPSVALILMMIGIYGLIFEFANPGSGVGGVLGGICLVLALYAMQLLPVSYAGIGLILLGVVFMAMEALTPSFGVLGIGGAAAFIAGAVILIDTEVPGYGIPLPLILALGVTCAVLIFATLAMALKARQRKRLGGDDELLGSLVAVSAVKPNDPRDGWVSLQGENWQVRSATPLQAGQQVRVLARRGLWLDVAAANGKHLDGGA